MKQQTLSLSPFIVLLAPVLLIIAMIFLNPKSEQESEKFQAAACPSGPTVKGVFQTLFLAK